MHGKQCEPSISFINTVLTLAASFDFR